jgi:hypothetical protein
LRRCLRERESDAPAAISAPRKGTLDELHAFRRELQCRGIKPWWPQPRKKRVPREPWGD